MSKKLNNNRYLKRILKLYPSYKADYSRKLSFFKENMVYRDFYPVTLWGGGELRLPFKQVNQQTGIASLMISQLDHKILHLLIDRLSLRIKKFQQKTGIKIESVAGIAKQAYLLAQGIAEKLGLPDWVPLDSGDKTWYIDDLSTQSTSITSKGGKVFHFDPYIIHRVYGKYIALVDDVVSSGGTGRAGKELLSIMKVKGIVFPTIFTEGRRWTHLEGGNYKPIEVLSLGHLPLFNPLKRGWVIRLGTN